MIASLWASMEEWALGIVVKLCSYGFIVLNLLGFWWY